MQIVYSAVDGGTDYRREARQLRLVRLDQLVETIAAVVAGSSTPDLVVFPAGYFQLASATELNQLVADVARQLDRLRPPFGVIWGMDIDDDKRVPKTEQAFDHEHPFFISYRSADGELWKFQQVSVTAAEGTAAHVAARWGERPLVLPGTQAALLICGECWSDALLERVARAGCKALVIAAHRNVKMHREPGGYGRLSWHIRLDGYQRSSGIPTVLSEHTRSPERHPYAWPAEISEVLSLPGVPPTVTLRRATITGAT